MRVLLTGASGFIGRYVARQLIAERTDYVTLGRRPSSNHHIEVDLLDSRAFSPIVKTLGATHLIHLAWYTEHGKYDSSLRNIDWIKATATLVDAFCQAGGSHVTISGSCAEYDWREGDCSEDKTPINPATIYGAAKEATWRICASLCSNYGVPLAWARIFFPYGKGEPETRLLPSLAAVWQSNKAAFGVNGDSYRDWLHVTDVANALLTVSRQQVDACINISSGEAVQIRDLVRMMAKACAANPDDLLALPPTRPQAAPYIIGNNQRLRQLGWQAQVTLKQGINDFINSANKHE